MNQLIGAVKNSKTIAISGHIRPDGDCTGSCLALYNYIIENYEGIKVDVYLEEIKEEFQILKNADLIKHSVSQTSSYDLFIVCDCSDKDRLGEFSYYYDHSALTICIDHHISNSGFGDIQILDAKASSTSEIIFGLLDEDKISHDTASALYLAIVHDTGVFKHSNTTRRTMETAGALVEKGVNTSYIIDETFYRKTYLQNQLLGRALLESILFLDGKGIFSSITKKTLDFYGAVSSDLDGIVDHLRITKGIEVAVLIYETDDDDFKVSMRSNSIIDVSVIAKAFGGGGHIRAAGCSMTGTIHDVINNLAAHMEHQLKAEEDLD